VIKRLLFLASTVCTVIVVLSFAFFAVEEAHASTNQQVKVEAMDQPNPTPAQEKARAKKHTQVREWIDKANDVLTKPFDNITSSNNIWVERAVPALLAFLLYFVVLRVLAGYAVKLRV
jgi:predicted PurR-regulated permease PerM